MKRQTFARGCALPLTRHVRARIIILVAAIDLELVNIISYDPLWVAYHATVRPGATLKWS
jgi:hypothetical protein